MDRFILTDDQWTQMAPHCLGKLHDPGQTGTNNRLFIEGVLWISRTGGPWRDLPDCFGKWYTVYKRFSRWRDAGVFEKIFAVMSGTPDMEYAMIDGTIVKVHRHGQGAKGGPKIRL